MTDDESRRAFEESAGSVWPLDRLADGEYFDYEMRRAWLWWDDAWQKATKRERERCLSLANGNRFGALDPDIRTLIYFIDKGLQLPSIEESKEPAP